MYIDTHAHLNDPRYEGERDAIVSSFKENGLKFVINVGYDAKSSLKGVELASKWEDVYAAVAVHPHDAKDFTDEDLKRFEEYSKNPKVVAIGETGLDYHYDFSPRETQKKVFIHHLELAHSLGLPIIIHLREAFDDMLKILKEHRALLEYGAVLHCYSGSAEMAKVYLDMGLYISFAGPVTFRNARGLLDAVRAVPLGRILTETDCPYLAPEPHRGQLNYPHYVRYVADKIAELKGITSGELNAQVLKNARALFKRIRHE
jgi:TatD DNase family protein